MGLVFPTSMLIGDRPILALVGGLEAPPGRVMGHAGAWAAPGEPDAETKYKALERAGAVMVNHPEKFGDGMKALLGSQLNRPCASVSRWCPVVMIDILTCNSQSPVQSFIRGDSTP